MTIQQMRYFFQVCHWQNITKAAEGLHIAQSSLSLAMQNLEKETGLNLFRHVGRRIEITSDGQKLLTKVTAMLAHVDRFDEAVRELADKHNVVRIAIPPQIAIAIIPELLSEFPKLYPEIQLELVEVAGPDVVELVRGEKVDIGLINLFEEKHSDITYNLIRKIPIGIVAKKGSRFAQYENISYEEAAEEPMILLESGHFVTQKAINAFDKHGVGMSVVHYTNMLSTIYQSIRRNDFVSILTGYSAPAEGDMLLIPFKEPLKLTTYSIVKKGRQISSDQKVLLKFVKEKLRDFM